jgi:hypothetical protein
MPKHSYQLVNPVIEGTFKDVYDAKSADEAANNMWSDLSEHIMAHVPKFMFTMKNISTDELHHFEVSENRNSKSSKEDVTFSINKLNMKIDKKLFDDFAKKIDTYDKNIEEKHQSGGRVRYDTSSSSSSSSSSTDYPDHKIRRTSPITLFHYNTSMYFPSNYYTYQPTTNPHLVSAAVVAPIFTPIFRPALGTYIGIWP